jgi:hypothetical protein
LNVSEYEKLIARRSPKMVDSILDDIENYNKNNNYTSLYLTASKRLNKQYPNYVKPEWVPKDFVSRNTLTPISQMWIVL